MTVAMLHSDRQLKAERDRVRDTENGCHVKNLLNKTNDNVCSDVHKCLGESVTV